MSQPTEQRSKWFYDGIWGMLSSVFCVPREAPVLPSLDADSISSRKPSPSYVGYLKFQACLVLILIGVPLIIGLIVLAVAENPWFLVGTFLSCMALCVLALVAILAVYLRYDTMWYVFSDRSMRLRRGIWVIRESTITFENIQNVKVMQGPLQRWFGIANVVVETAGGGGSHEQHGGGLGMHSGVIEGIADATAIRDSIMKRVRLANTTGLGDESIESLDARANWPASHMAILREIRDLAKQASGS